MNAGRLGTSALLAAAILFAIYFANVLAGAAGEPEFLNNVHQALILLASACVFVVGIIAKEAAAQR